MELDELSSRLQPFCESHYPGDEVHVEKVEKMPGHAGFSYGFTVVGETLRESWFLRLPPPNVNWKGTADVLRQVDDSMFDDVVEHHLIAEQARLMRRKERVIRARRERVAR